MLPSLVEVGRVVHDDGAMTRAWLQGVATAWRASGRFDGLWVWCDDSYEPPEMSVWAPAEPIATAVRPGSGIPPEGDAS